MKVIEIKCQNCNANFELESDHLISYCPYCGTELTVEVKQAQQFLDGNESKYDYKNYKERFTITPIEKKVVNDDSAYAGTSIILGIILLIIGFVSENPILMVLGGVFFLIGIL